MRLLLAVIYCLFLGHVWAQKPQDVYLAREFVAADGTKLPYRLLLPDSFDVTKRYPLVLFLHGAGERGNDNKSQLVHGAGLFLQPEVRKAYPAILIFPQCAADDYWAEVRRGDLPVWEFPFLDTPRSSMQAVVELLDSLIAHAPLDTMRLYVGGLSMGGFGTFDLLARFPERFAAAFPICGGGNRHLTQLYAPNTNLWIFHGSDDNIVPPENSRLIYQKLKQHGADVRYTEYPGVNHNSWDSAFAEPDLLRWLFTQYREK